MLKAKEKQKFHAHSTGPALAHGLGRMAQPSKESSSGRRRYARAERGHRAQSAGGDTAVAGR
jgi:hypothetical protein